MTSRRDFLASTPALGFGAFSAPQQPTACAPGTFAQAVIAGDIAEMTRCLAADRSLVYARDAADTPLFIVAHVHKQKAAADLLIQHGYVPDLPDMAAAGDVDRVTKMLAEDITRLYQRDRRGRNALTFAAAAGQTRVVDFLVGRGFTMDPPAGAPDASAVLLAVDYPDDQAAEAMAQMMLGNGADPNAPQPGGRSPLHAAAERGRGYLVALLVRKGARTDARDAAGRTPVDLARAAGRVEVARMLESAGGLPRDAWTTRYVSQSGTALERDDNYGLPQALINLFVTVSHFDLERTRKLLTQVPDLLLTRATWNELGVEGAAHLGNYANLDFLLGKGSPLSLPTMVVLGMNAEVRSALAATPARIHERGVHDFPMLWYTAWGREQVAIAEALLGAGTDVNIGVRGRTTLHLAAQKGHVDLAKLLLERGADVNARSRSDNGAMPVALAIAAKKDAVAALLRDHGGSA